MKVGDLVTLSAYGEQLTRMKTYTSHYREKYYNKNPLMGIIVKEWGCAGNEFYYVKWLNESNPQRAPKSRDGQWSGTFDRKDLKHVRKIKSFSQVS